MQCHWDEGHAAPDSVARLEPEKAVVSITEYGHFISVSLKVLALYPPVIVWGSIRTAAQAKNQDRLHRSVLMLEWSNSCLDHLTYITRGIFYYFKPWITLLCEIIKFFIEVSLLKIYICIYYRLKKEKSHCKNF